MSQFHKFPIFPVKATIFRYKLYLIYVPTEKWQLQKIRYVRNLFLQYEFQ